VSPRKAAAFAFTESELSPDARAILAYARKHGEPFARPEIVGIAPGADWDYLAPYPRTVAALDPLRELVKAGLVELHDVVPVKSDRRHRKTYKLWKLTGVDVPRTLAELLDALIDVVADGRDDPGMIKAEILRRFGDSR
jgi:hypothetical protein